MRLKFIKETRVHKKYENDIYTLTVTFPFRDDPAMLQIKAESKIRNLYPSVIFSGKEDAMIYFDKNSILYEDVNMLSEWERAVKDLVEEVQENYDEIVTFTTEGL